MPHVHLYVYALVHHRYFILFTDRHTFLFFIAPPMRRCSCCHRDNSDDLICRRDLWELRAEFSRLSSSLLTSCTSARPLVTFSLTPDLQTPRSSSVPPLLSADGPLSIEELALERREREKEREIDELREQHKSEKQKLRNRRV